jgi:hypothetical protein
MPSRLMKGQSNPQLYKLYTYGTRQEELVVPRRIVPHSETNIGSTIAGWLI